MSYADFLAEKRSTVPEYGFSCSPADLPGSLFDFQRHIVAWAVRRGRAAIFADTGLGKTRMQLAWADRMTPTDGRALILAPLAVAQQTIREAHAMGLELTYAADQSQAGRLTITNYDRLHLFDSSTFHAVVLDESSVLKDVTTKTRDQLIDAFRATPYRLCCTATPAPNDLTELANHAEFLGIATRRNMLSTYFITDLTRGWRVRGHAETAMWQWVASWALACRTPSDLGYPDSGYALPALDLRPHLLPVNVAGDGELFAAELGGVSGRAKVRRETLAARVRTTVNLVAGEPDEPWLLWCGLNDEADALTAAIPGAVNVHGAMPADRKAAALLDFTDGRIPTLITKPSVAGWGMNWQHCARMAFVGLGDSYEAYYQCIRRCWRYGQTRPVDVHIVLSELEHQIASNVARKEATARTALDKLIAAQRTAQEHP
ncbi:SNF2-related protein [uncultured Jatrophihabitans sp.]|uniref:SNF2-related protein n=1 Tax=uncultured Jatrophihabitans sp. TaxID=1610747 RepID=UPI0035CC81AE